MDRSALYKAWVSYFSHRMTLEGWSNSQVIEDIRKRVDALGGRMRALARFPDAYYHGFVRSRLMVAMGMSLGVLKQVSWGLTFSAPGV